jgi:hypothetical protein
MLVFGRVLIERSRACATYSDFLQFFVVPDWREEADSSGREQKFNTVQQLE